MLESAFREQLSKADKSLGDLAVICDKNMMEASGYAAVLAEVAKEPVWLAEWHDGEEDVPVKWVDRILHVRDANKGKERVWLQAFTMAVLTLTFFFFLLSMQSGILSVLALDTSPRNHGTDSLLTPRRL